MRFARETVRRDTKGVNVQALRGSCVNTISEFERCVNSVSVRPRGKTQGNGRKRASA